MINSFEPITKNFTPPTIAVSACLLGEKVRYDGKDKNQSQDIQLIKQYCHVQAICPEVAAGLGVPRPAVQLMQSAKGIQALGVKQKHINVTEGLKQQARLLTAIKAHGFVLKSRSPSCGIDSTPIFNHQGQQQQLGSGIIAWQLQQDGRLLIDEIQLQNKAYSRAFIHAAQLLADLQQSSCCPTQFIRHHALNALACNKQTLKQQIVQHYHAQIKGANNV